MSATVLEPGSSNISRIEQLSHEIIQLIIADKQQLDIKDRKLLEKKAVYEKELSSVLDDERSKLQEYENQFIEAKSQLEYNQSKFTQTVHTTKIKLDIGGKTFSTSKTSLSHVPGSFFSSIIEGKVSAEEDGSFFIDRYIQNFREWNIVFIKLRTQRSNSISLDIKFSTRLSSPTRSIVNC